MIPEIPNRASTSCSLARSSFSRCSIAAEFSITFWMYSFSIPSRTSTRMWWEVQPSRPRRW